MLICTNSIVKRLKIIYLYIHKKGDIRNISLFHYNLNLIPSLNNLIHQFYL
jgi:hypothetical protein